MATMCLPRAANTGSNTSETLPRSPGHFLFPSQTPSGTGLSHFRPTEGNRGLPGAHLFQWQLPEQWQRAGEQPDEEGGRRAHDVDHGRGQHGDVGVLPGEGVDDRHHRVAALGQCAAARREGERGLAQGGCGLRCCSGAWGGRPPWQRPEMFAVQPKGMYVGEKKCDTHIRRVM